MAVITGARASQTMGLENAEIRLIEELYSRRASLDIDVRVIGRRSARDYARRLGGRWYPSLHVTSSARASRGVDLVHLAGLTLAPPKDVRFVATFHDLSPFHYDDEAPFPRWGWDIASSALALTCPSKFIARELHQQLSVPLDRIRVIPNGPGIEISSGTEPLTASQLKALGLTQPFALRLGGWTKRKNVPFLLEAWQKVEERAEISLALAGPPQARRDAELAKRPLRSLRTLDYVPGITLPGLLRSAMMLVTTSEYEGFGLPALEAMTAGVPVVAFRTPFIEEICGDAAILADNPEAFAVSVTRLAADPELRAQFALRGVARAKSFTWARAADSLIEFYREQLTHAAQHDGTNAGIARRRRRFQ